MLTRLYVDALLVDEHMADVVWELWNAGRTGEPGLRIYRSITSECAETSTFTV